MRGSVDTSSFSAKIKAFLERQLPQAVERKVDATGEKLLAKVKEKTPIDTGAAKDAWELQKSGAGHQRTARVSNPLPYVTYLEHGSSEQAPNGIVRVSIEELKRGQ